MGANKKPGDRTPKQEKFCREYMLDLNATQAAIRAGYSRKTAYRIGYENLRKPHIIKRLQELRAPLMEKYEITPERIMQELSIQGFLDPALFFTKTGVYTHIKDLEDLPPEITRAITGINIKYTLQGTEYSYRFGGKTKSLELMMRRLGMLTDKLIMDNRLDIFKHANKKKLKAKYDKLRNGKPGNRGR